MTIESLSRVRSKPLGEVQLFCNRMFSKTIHPFRTLSNAELQCIFFRLFKCIFWVSDASDVSSELCAFFGFVQMHILGH